MRAAGLRQTALCVSRRKWVCALPSETEPLLPSLIPGEPLDVLHGAASPSPLRLIAPSNEEHGVGCDECEQSQPEENGRHSRGCGTNYQSGQNKCKAYCQNAARREHSPDVEGRQALPRSPFSARSFAVDLVNVASEDVLYLLPVPLSHLLIPTMNSRVGSAAS